MLSSKVGVGVAVHRDRGRLPTGQRCTRVVRVQRNLDAGSFAEDAGDVHVLKSMEFGLPQMFRRKMRDVVLQHVVLRFQCGELRYKAGVTGRVEDDTRVKLKVGDTLFVDTGKGEEASVAPSLQCEDIGADEACNRNDAARGSGLREPRGMFDLLSVCAGHSSSSG